MGKYIKTAHEYGMFNPAFVDANPEKFVLMEIMQRRRGDNGKGFVDYPDRRFFPIEEVEAKEKKGWKVVEARSYAAPVTPKKMKTIPKEEKE